MKRHYLNSLPLSAAAVVLSAALSFGSLSAFAQSQQRVAPPVQGTPQGQLQGAQPLEAGQPAPALTPNQLDDLVAPIALYPDPLLSQILVASTYPLEVVLASQWLQKNSNLSGASLTQAAETQNWDPSVQALVVYPDVVKRLNEDVTWTNSLGEAFLSQESDVMDAVQRMRSRAQGAGKLASTPQQLVTTVGTGAQPLIEIMPASSQVIYVPSYDPSSIWGPSNYYPYPNWYYPPIYGSSFGSSYMGFGAGIPVGLYYGSGGWGGWNSYGWMPGWGGRTVVVNNGFFNRYNFNTRGAPVLVGTTPWAYNGIHRLGVPYRNPALYARYGGYARPRVVAPIGGYGFRAVNPAVARPAYGYRAPTPGRFNGVPNRGVYNGGSTFRAGTPARLPSRTSSPAPIRSGAAFAHSSPGGGGAHFRSGGGGAGHSGGGAGHGGGGHR